MESKMLEIKKLLESKLQLDFNSAGNIAYIDGKKKFTIPHTDNHPIDEDTNVLKAQLDNKYLIIDSDESDLDTLEDMYPSIVNTFATQTTSETKRHFYFKCPSTIKNVRKIKLQANGEYDILTTGIIFEGHSITGQEAEWRVVNDTSPIELSPTEILHLSNLSNTSSSSKLPRVYFMDEKVGKIVREAVINDRLPTTRKDMKDLIMGLTNQDYQNEIKASKAKNIPFPEFGHMVINTMAYKLSYNMAVSHLERDAILDIILRDVYDIDSDSTLTDKHLRKSILATLPRHEALKQPIEYDNFRDMLLPTIMNGYGMVKFIDNGEIKFLEIDEHTFKPRNMGRYDNAVLSQNTVLSLRQYSKEDLQLIPLVKVVVNPFQSSIWFEGSSNIDIINLAQHSRYYEEAVPVEEIPDNVITRLVYSYFGSKYQDFYYHWLAHCMYHTRAPQTMPMLVSPSEDRGSTGKSSLAQAIPQRLIFSASTADPQQTESGWGDSTAGRKLVCFNDMKEMHKAKWGAVHAFAKDHSTSGARRMENMKFGGFTLTSHSNAFSFSANWVPPIDEHDRRLWYVFPQSLYGDTGFLDEDDVYTLNHMLEHSQLDDYHTELQDVANYLKYLYEYDRERYNTELYISAPQTEYRDIALKQQKTYSESLIPSIAGGPEQLENLVGDTHIEFYCKIIILQFYIDKVCLPWNLLAHMLHNFNEDGNFKNRKAQVAAVLKIDVSKFANQSSKFKRYLEPEHIAGFSQDEKDIIDTFTQQMLPISMSGDILDKYIDYLEELYSKEKKDVVEQVTL